METFRRERMITGITLAIFFLCLAVGFWMAGHKPVWNDEIYSQINSVERLSYRDIVLRKVGEGNGNPLFYLIQKGISDLFRYRFPGEWKGEWHIQDLRSQMVMRVQPNLFMSLSIALLFWFFARRYSVGAGTYALVVTLSSFMLWAYWAEGRPYALWFFLTTAQSLLFLSLTEQDEKDSRRWTALTAVHLLLSLTVVFGVVQIWIFSAMLWLGKERRWRRYVWPTLVPTGIGLAYYLASPKFKFFFTNTPLQLVGASIPKDRLFLLSVYAVFLALDYLGRKTRGAGIFRREAPREGGRYLVAALLMLASAFGILWLLKTGETPDKAGFSISNRYFIYLAPAGIIMVVLASLDVVRAFRRNFPLRVIGAVLLALLLAFRFYRTYLQVRGIF